MRLYLFSLLFAISQAFAGNAQTVTLHGRNIPLSKVFDEIRKQTDYLIVGDREILKDRARVHVQVDNIPVHDVLNQVLKGREIRFEIEERNIVLTRIPSHQPIVSIVLHNGQLDFPRKVSGRIFDAEGRFLQSVSVRNRSTKKTSVSSHDGIFIIEWSPGDEIEFTSIGYDPLITQVSEDGKSLLSSTTGKSRQQNSSHVLNGDAERLFIQLKQSISSLDEVQVLGYGQTTQRLNTGNSTTISGDDLAIQPVFNPLLALKGKVPGVYITPTTKFSASPVFTEIRGRKSINPDQLNEPLIIIDGIPQNTIQPPGTFRYGDGDFSGSSVSSAGVSGTDGQSPLFGLNLQNIENITVLQDADATAIYGARGANGVIIINTKRGTPGKTTVGVNISNSYTVPRKVPRLLNTEEYLQYRRQSFENAGIFPDPNVDLDLTKWDPDAYIDWPQEMAGTGRSTSYGMYIQGGDENSTFRISGQYANNRDLFATEGKNNMGSIDANFLHRSKNRKLTFSLNSGYRNTFVNAVDGRHDLNMFLPPNAPPIYDENGNLNWNAWDAGRSNGYPFSGLAKIYETNNNAFDNSASINFEPISGLVLSGQIGIGYNINENKALLPLAAFAPNNPSAVPNTSFGVTRILNRHIEGKVEYLKHWGPLMFNSFIAGSLDYSSTRGDDVIGLGYDDDELMWSIKNALMAVPQDHFVEYKFASVFARLGLNYDQKYILNLNLRRDGSSRFAPKEQYGNFGSISGAWILSGEKWFDSFLPKWISFAKLRGSAGITGSDGIPEYQFLSSYSKYNGFQMSLPYQDRSVYLPIIPGSQHFRWESNFKTEAGIMLAFFNDLFNIEYYQYWEYAGNQLTAIPVPAYTGFSNYLLNWNALVRNSGNGLRGSYRSSLNNKRSLNVDFFIAANRNKLLKYPNIEESPYYSRYIVGESITLKYFQRFLGVDPLTGVYAYEDANKDGRITNTQNTPPGLVDDRVASYDTRALFSGGITPTLILDNFSVRASISFASQLGEDPTYLAYRNRMQNMIFSEDLLYHHWKKPGDISDYQINAHGVNARVSRIVDKSYLQIDNVTIQYSLPKSMTSFVKVHSATLGLTVSNLFLFSKYTGELLFFWNSFTPSPRTFNGSLSVQF